MKYGLILLVILYFFTCSSSLRAEVLANSEIFVNIKDEGIGVFIRDQVTGSCWARAASSENKAITALRQYGLYNGNSQYTLGISAIGFKNVQLCIVSLDLQLYSWIQPFGIALHASSETLMSGGEQSEQINLQVEEFIEEIIAAFAKAGL